jgi:DNA-binding transcriptional LysR family regulator
MGAGIAILPDKIVGEDVADNKLTRVLPDWKAEAVTVYALTETRLLPAKTQVFIEFMRENLSEKAD